MAQTIDFNKAMEQMKQQKEMDEMRAMVDRMRELESDPDYDPSEALQDTIAEEDPKLASLIEDYATVSSQAELGRRRLAGEPIEGTDFEKVRDQRAILEEAKVGWEMNKQLHKNK